MSEEIARSPLVDHHCHGLMTNTLSRSEFEELATESSARPPAGTTVFDTQLGFLIRARCAPILDLPAHASADDYIRTRAELGVEEVNRRFMSQAGISTFIVETGYRGAAISSPKSTAAYAMAAAHEVVRLEKLAEDAAEQSSDATEFVDQVVASIRSATTRAVGFKSIAAYRIGLGFDPSPPARSEVIAAAGAWLAEGAARLSDPVIIRFLLEEASAQGLPIQFHIGYGDDDVDLHRCNPLLLTEWIRRVRERGCSIMLLHCYPFHREAGYLAHVYEHVYADIGLAVNYVGARADALVAEFLELIPFHKALFSSDAFGLAELYYLGAFLFRRGFDSVVTPWVERGDWSAHDAARVFEMIAQENASRVYGVALR